jgi:protein O-mannosyl-transferase
VNPSSGRLLSGFPRLSPGGRTALLAAAIVLAAVAAHTPLYRADYVQDDHLAVEKNAVVARGDVVAIVSGSYWEGARGQDRTLYRPVTVLTYALERQLVGASDPRVSHTVNVLLHALVALALALIARRLGGSRWAAAAAGLLFALHPVLTEAVANVVGRAEILAALFTLGALLAMSASGPWGPPGARATAGSDTAHRLASWGAAALVFLALGSKETAAAGIGLLAAQEMLFRPPRENRVRAWLVDRGAALAPVALAVVLHAILRVRALEAVALAQIVPPADNPLVRLEGVERLATALAIAARYGRLIFLPVRLSADYSGDVIATERTLLAPRPLAGLAFLAAWVLLAALPLLREARRRSAEQPPRLLRQLSFSAVLFLLPYLVIGNLLFQVGAGMAERFLYFPTAGYCLLLALVMGRLVEGEVALVPATPSQLRRLVGLAFALLLAGFALGTASRCLEWRNDRTLFEAALRINPLSLRAQFIVASLDAKEGRSDEALLGMDTVLRLWPEHLPAWVQKGALLGRRGDIAGAEAACREAVRLGPSNGDAHFNLGVALHRQGRLAEAERSERKAVLFNPSLDQAWAELGNILMEERRYSEAADAFARALALGRTAVRQRLEDARRLAGTKRIRSAASTPREPPHRTPGTLPSPGDDS